MKGSSLKSEFISIKKRERQHHGELEEKLVSLRKLYAQLEEHSK